MTIVSKNCKNGKCQNKACKCKQIEESKKIFLSELVTYEGEFEREKIGNKDTRFKN